MLTSYSWMCDVGGVESWWTAIYPSMYGLGLPTILFVNASFVTRFVLPIFQIVLGISIMIFRTSSCHIFVEWGSKLAVGSPGFKLLALNTRVVTSALLIRLGIRNWGMRNGVKNWASSNLTYWNLCLSLLPRI